MAMDFRCPGLWLWDAIKRGSQHACTGASVSGTQVPRSLEVKHPSPGGWLPATGGGIANVEQVNGKGSCFLRNLQRFPGNSSRQPSFCGTTGLFSSPCGWKRCANSDGEGLFLWGRREGVGCWLGVMGVLLWLYGCTFVCLGFFVFFFSFCPMFMPYFSCCPMQ